MTSGKTYTTIAWTVGTQTIGGVIAFSVMNASEYVPEFVSAFNPRIQRFTATPEILSVTPRSMAGTSTFTAGQSQKIAYQASPSLTIAED